MTLCDKYKPSCFADIKGQDEAIQKIQNFIQNFPRKKVLILHGPAGTGKTSLAYALASETKSEILEINASDLRNSEQIKTVLGHASQQQSLFGNQENQRFSRTRESFWDSRGQKILLVDEVDGITRNDRGGLPEIIRIIQTTNFPVIITANNIWDRKFNQLRKSAELLQLKELNYNVILNILKQISEKESLNLNEEILKSLSIKSKGDVRAAINDLQTLHPDTEHDHIHERDKQTDIFLTLKKIFQELPSQDTLFLYDKVNMNLDEIFLWLEENLPSEYSGEELYKALDSLSKADVFRGRIHRQQHWRFLVYENFLLSAGIQAAKKQVKSGFTSYKKPTRILKIWIINQKLKYKKSISIKYAKHTHTNKKRAEKEFPYIKQILQNPQTQKELKLDEKEIEFLNKN